MSRTQEIETALRSLDAADPRLDAGSARSVVDLERILSSPPAPARLGPRRSKLALAAAALATATAAVVALPSFSGGDAAFASWTPAPGTSSAEDGRRAADGCREAQEDGAGASYASQLAAARPVIAERRGAWTTVVLAGADGFSALCITDDSSPFFARDSFGSVGTPTNYRAPGPRDLVATSLGAGGAEAGPLSVAVGFAGADVAAVVYRSATRGDVAATVSQGHFALWLPGDELEGASSRGVDLEVTYRDGTSGTTRLVL